MGRYDDRIKVYYQNDWHSINRIRVYANGAWQDLGTNDSANTRELYAKNGTNQGRITRDRVDTQRSETVGSGYHQGEWAISTRQQYCFNFRPASTNTGATKTKFHAFFKVKASGECKLFSFHSAYFNNTWFESKILSNGKIWYRVKDGGGNGSWTPSDNKHTTTNAIQMGFDKDWQTIEFIGAVGSDTMKVKINGQEESFPRHTAWETNSKNAKVGDANLRIATDGTFKIDTANRPFTSITENTTTNYYTETTWV